jgi:hypothetical protein
MLAIRQVCGLARRVSSRSASEKIAGPAYLGLVTEFCSSARLLVNANTTSTFGTSFAKLAGRCSMDPQPKQRAGLANPAAEQ